jgi:Tol biopolymer transport system component
MRTYIAAALLLFCSGAVLPAQSGQALFERALTKERVDGDLRGAIQLYEQIVRDFAKDRPLAARALEQLGGAYEKLGRADARTAYERLIREFGDQRETVARVRARLAALERAAVPSTAMSTRQLWTGRSVELSGGLSGDGKYLSFVDWDTGDLALRDLEAGQSRRLTNKGSWSDSWEFAETSAISADSRYVAYAWLTLTARFELRMLPVSGGKTRTLFADPTVIYVHVHSFPADGSQVLVTLQSANGDSEIALVATDGGPRKTVVKLDWRWPGSASISRDGRFVAYDFPPREDSALHDIYVVTVATGEQHRVADHPRDDRQPLWTPDDRGLVFLSDRSGSMAAWQLSMNGSSPAGSPRLLKGDMTRTTMIGFSRGGSLLYGLQSGMRDVYLAEVDPAAGSVLRDPSIAIQHYVGTNWMPDWAGPNRIVYLSDRFSISSGPRSRMLCIADVESGEVKEHALPFGFFNRPRASPDGRTIVLNGQLKGRSGLYFVDAESGRLSEFVISPSMAGAPSGASFTPDGAAVIYTVPDISGTPDAASTLMLRELQSGAVRELARNANDGAVSPDMKWLAYWTWQQGTNLASSLQLRPFEGGAARELDRAIGSSPLTWTPDGRYILYAKQLPKGESELWGVAVDSGNKRRIEVPQRRLRTPRLNPDGRRLLFAAGDTTPELWVVSNLLPAPRPAATQR